MYSIVADKDAFWCEKCHKAHRILYRSPVDRWCESCVTDDVKEQVEYMNQNQEPIKI